jgi:hypothetical protein
MTKREQKMKSMLNYFEIDMHGTRDEKMTTKESVDFLDKFNVIYDSYTVDEIIKKLRGDRESIQNEDTEESEDPFFDSMKGDSGLPQHNRNPFFDNMKSPFDFGSKGPFGINPEIEKFLDWMTNLLYSADHKVVISEEGNITHIKLHKIKSKRGGKKK